MNLQIKGVLTVEKINKLIATNPKAFAFYLVSDKCPYQPMLLVKCSREEAREINCMPSGFTDTFCSKILGGGSVPDGWLASWPSVGVEYAMDFRNESMLFVRKLKDSREEISLEVFE